MAILYLSLIVCLYALIIFSAFYDFFRLRIPNYIPLALAALFLMTFFVAENAGMTIFQPFNVHFLAGVILLIIMFGMFSFGLIGGGDAKIIPAIALWVGTEGLLDFLIWTGLFGFPLAIISLFLKNTAFGQATASKASSHKILNKGWIKALANGENVVPYGIAIAAGAILAFQKLSYLP